MSLFFIILQVLLYSKTLLPQLLYSHYLAAKLIVRSVVLVIAELSLRFFISILLLSPAFTQLFIFMQFSINLRWLGSVIPFSVVYLILLNTNNQFSSLVYNQSD